MGSLPGDPVAAPLGMIERGPRVIGHKHRGGAAVGYFAGLDVSLEETAICIVDDAGMIVREARVASEPEVLVAFFEACGMTMERVGLEACSLTAWLHAGADGGGHTGDLHRGAPGEGGDGCDAEQDGPQRRARDRADHAHRLVSRGAREEPVLPLLACAADGAADGAQQATRRRERYAGAAARGRAEGRHAKPQRLPGAGARTGSRRPGAD